MSFWRTVFNHTLQTSIYKYLPRKNPFLALFEKKYGNDTMVIWWRENVMFVPLIWLTFIPFTPGILLLNRKEGRPFYPISDPCVLTAIHRAEHAIWMCLNCSFNKWNIHFSGSFMPFISVTTRRRFQLTIKRNWEKPCCMELVIRTDRALRAFSERIRRRLYKFIGAFSG